MTLELESLHGDHFDAFYRFEKFHPMFSQDGSDFL